MGLSVLPRMTGSKVCAWGCLQAHNGRLPMDVARVVMAGMGPSLPLPRMQVGGHVPCLALCLPAC